MPTFPATFIEHFNVFDHTIPILPPGHQLINNREKSLISYLTFCLDLIIHENGAEIKVHKLNSALKISILKYIVIQILYG